MTIILMIIGHLIINIMKGVVLIIMATGVVFIANGLIKFCQIWLMWGNLGAWVYIDQQLHKIVGFFKRG